MLAKKRGSTTKITNGTVELKLKSVRCLKFKMSLGVKLLILRND